LEIARQYEVEKNTAQTDLKRLGRKLANITNDNERGLGGWSVADIAAYLDAAGEAVTGSVGAYQLERLGVHLFERIEGDHFTILGLPLLPLLAFLRSAGLLGV